MARNTRTFKDIDLSFRAHPVTGDISAKFDEEAIKQSIKNLVLTKNYERPFHPELGSQVNALLFENAGPMTENLLRTTITNVIKNYEPRAELLDIAISHKPDQNGTDVKITFRIINTFTPVELFLALERTR